MITIPNLGLFDAVWYTALLLPLLALARQSRGRDPLEGAVCRGRGVAYVGVSPHGDIQKWAGNHHLHVGGLIFLMIS